MENIIYIVGGVFLLLVIIGMFAGETEAEEQKEEKKRTLYEKLTNSDDPVKVFRKEQRKKLAELRKFSPSVLRNSVIMWIIQIVSLLGMLASILGVVVFSLKDFQGFKSEVMIPVLIVAIIFFRLINLMAKMIRLRNKYIIRLEELID